MSKAALYAYFKKRHINKKRWFYAGQSLMTAVVVVLAVVLQTYLDIKPPTYKLDEATYGLIGQSRDDAAQYLTENKDKKTFSFALPASEDNQAKEHTGRKADAYETVLSTDVRQGITYTDTATQIGITLVPKFRTGEGKKVEGDHIVYPMGTQRLIYTLKYNGLKEDIVIPKYIANDLNYEFELSLPTGVEARLDDAGNIGIYSSDPTLFGEVSYGSDADRAKLDTAREKGEKTNLIVTIPSPIIKDSRGNEYNDRASFTLGERKQEQAADGVENKNLPAEVREQLKSKSTKNVYTLGLKATNLKDLSYPISLDPTMQSDNAADFSRVVLEGGIEADYSSNSLIKRGSLSGGLVSARQSLTAMSDTLREPVLVVSGSTLYKIGGCKRVTANFGGCDTTTTQVDYATITSSGTIGAWANTNSSLPAGATVLQATTYNGYIYIHGDTHTTPKYARIGNDKSLYKADGTKGWDTGTIPTQSIYGAGFVAVKGYLYILGGVSGTRNYAQYAVLNGDGSIGTWSTTTAINTATQEINAVAYNGFIYIVGGYDTDVVQYGKVNDDGTISAWNTTTAFPNRIFAHRIVAFKGYLYSFGGRNETGAVVVNTIQYAQINGDGSVGTWRLSSVGMSTNRIRHSIATNGKYIFSSGGCTNGSSSSCNASTDVNTVESYTIAPAGTTNTGTTESNTFTTARMGHGTIVAFGYIYVLGGCTIDQGSCDTNAETLGSTYYAPINSSGTVGSWTAGTNFPTIATNAQTRGVLSATIVDKYIYVIAGSGNCGTLGAYSNYCTEVFYASITAGSGALSAWTNSANPLPAGRRRGAAASYKGYIYYLGGENAGPQTTVYYASAGGGDIGAWVTTSSLGTARTLTAATAYAGYMYVGGGYDGTTNPAPIEYALINTDGNGGLGAFSNTASMSEIRDGATLQAYNGYLYIAGGYSGATHRSSIEYAQINTNGTLGAFSTSANGLTTAGRRYPGAGGIHNGILYIAGGTTTGGDTPLNSVESIPINNGGSGSTGTGTTSGNNFTTARTVLESVVARGFLYVIAGCTATSGGCTTVTNTVQKTAIAADGSIGAWSAETAISNSVQYHKAVTYNDHIYVIAGHNLTAAISTVEYTHVKADGTFEAPAGCGTIWCAATSLPGIRSSHASVVYNGYIYVLGGNSSSTVLYIKINGDGSLPASWSTGTSMSAARNQPNVVAYKGYLYVLGGESAPLSSTDGSVGAWIPTASLAAGYTTGGAVAANGYAYILGGGTADGIIQFAPLLAGGKVGTWTFATNWLATTRTNSRAVYYNGRIYSTGGNAGGTLLASTEYFGLQSIPRSGSYSRLVDFGNGVKPTKLITRGTKQTDATARVDYQSVNNTSSSFTNSQTITDTGYSGTNAQTLNLGTGVSLSRYLWLRYTIDDRMSAIFPDTGNESTITDFDIYFTVSPAGRLRGGRTFVEGTDRGLDAQPQ